MIGLPYRVAYHPVPDEPAVDEDKLHRPVSARRCRKGDITADFDAVVLFTEISHVRECSRSEYYLDPLGKGRRRVREHFLPS